MHSGVFSLSDLEQQRPATYVTAGAAPGADAAAPSTHAPSTAAVAAPDLTPAPTATCVQQQAQQAPLGGPPGYYRAPQPAVQAAVPVPPGAPVMCGSGGGGAAGTAGASVAPPGAMPTLVNMRVATKPAPPPPPPT